MVDVGVGEGERTKRKREDRGGGDKWEDGGETADAEGRGVSAMRTSCHPCWVL
jgi:hypothetical protein